MSCREQIVSEQTYDYITDFPIENTGDLTPVVCYETIEEAYNIVYLDRNRIPNPEANFFEYQSVPKLYGLMQEDSFPVTAEDASSALLYSGESNLVGSAFDPTNLIASGILQLQRAPLNLTGAGTLVCFIDTGIDYTSPIFRDEYGDTRIEAIWDQTDQTGTPPEDFLYGSEYTKKQIQEALGSQEPRTVVPTTDEIGHGTAIASVAAGSLWNNPEEQSSRSNQGAAIISETANNSETTITPEMPSASRTAIIPNITADRTAIPTLLDFRGAAPDAGIIVVKLKPAKEYLRRFFLLPEGVPAYQENDIMLAVKYCDRFARIFQRPVIICLGLGTSFGDHSGYSALSTYLNQIAVKRNRAVIVCGGNEGNTAHHFRGDLIRAQDLFSEGANYDRAYGDRSAAAQDVEIRVGENNGGFFLELWGKRPDILNVIIRSPGGETIPPLPLGIRQSITYGFVYERTQITVDSTLVEPSTGDELILFRFLQPTPGVWTIRVISQGDIQNGIYDLWLPLRQFQQSEVYFLSPNPDITLTEPAMAPEVIAVSAYNASTNAFYIDSGRGFSRSGVPRPDLSAPGVNVSTMSGKRSGSSYAAALTAGAVAQFLQWAVVEGNDPFAESREIKSYLIRGAKRETNLRYPNKDWGYGRLDMTGVFASLRT